MRRESYERFLNGLAWVSSVITGVAIVVLTVIFGWLVYGRYVLNATPTWVEQVALLLVALITFLGAATGVRQNTHLGVDMFRDAAPLPVTRFCKAVSHIAMALFGLVMAIYGFQLTLFKWATEIPLIHQSEGLRTVPITVCGILLVLYSAGHLWRLFSGADDYALDESE
ncbi:MAG: TRAP transporter small permease [Geminicoccaceae bacterium]|nr:TRAP transporter small permease [Geminicoccaceae bacterium]MCB2009816.1 TRAP transporter small permease [Geminicoccaceae bacterium]